MRKILFFVLFILLGAPVFSQVSQVKLVHYQTIRGFGQAGYMIVLKPVFEHEGSTLASDSALYNQNANTFDAYGHVVITQPSGTTIYSDLLNYNANTKNAILTNNVRMVDGDATLTTNYLTYNMTSKIGTYTGNGKIVNGDNVLTSKTGYYFSASRDAYFRYNVVLTTPDALIKTDTLRYNSNSKIAYFFGPTNIYGKDDTLYTENGNYNTNNEQARFGKNNLYTQGSKSLTGDSLFYDRIAGYGRATGNVIFIDTAEKAQLYGGIGTYRKSDESILVTKNPYIVILSESDSAKVDSIFMTADTLLSKVVFAKDVLPAGRSVLSAVVEDRVASAPEGNTGRDDLSVSGEIESGNLDDGNSTADSSSRDSSETTEPIITDAPPSTEQVQDTVKKISPPPDKAPVVRDTTPVTRDKVPVVRAKNDSLKASSLAEPVKSRRDSLNAVLPGDSTAIKPIDSMSNDTTRVRIVMAYRNAKIFKSDLQAKSDSMFFSYSDSTLRCYVNPMIWSDGSQLSGDTVFLQMKNKKMDNMLLQRNSFIVKAEDTDSTNFNQIKGKLINGYFKDSKLHTMFVDGNAESVYYVKDDTAYTGLNHQISSRIRITLADGKLSRIQAIKDVDASVTPMKDLTEEDRILEGFIWKPSERPKSKEEIIPQLRKKEVASKPAVSGKKTAPPPKTAPEKTPAVKPVVKKEIELEPS